jgi:multicomponent Na+:H+ antiporter subunit D
MRVLLPLPVVLPLLAAGLSLALHRHRWLQRALGLGTLAAVLVASVAMLLVVQSDGIAVVDVGGWEAPVGITLVADLLSTIMLAVANAMLLAVLVYAIGHPATEDERRFFHPTYLVLAAGVSLAFLTGDLFNLFVAFEVMLIASYVLITLGGSAPQVRSGMTYVVINLLSSTLFVTTVGLVYAATGTVNLADLAGRLDDVDPAIRTALGLMLLVVFGIKAAIFPLFSWLPDSYPTASSPVTAIFAGLLTKVGVYAIIRTQTLLFPVEGVSTVLLVLAGLTMLVGVLGAIAQNDVKRILSFHIVSQIGYMVLGVGLFTIAGIAGAIFYIVHHIVVKTTLFLVGGLIEVGTGTGAISRLSGLSKRSPVLAVLFALPALSLAGIPPFSGFVAKLGLVQAGLDIDQGIVIGVSLLVSLLTLFSMSKIWAGVFWGEPSDVEGPGAGRSDAGAALRSPPLMVAATGALVVTSLVIAFGASPLYGLATDAATSLMAPEGYVSSVLER